MRSRPGEIFTLIGPSGSGKTSLIRLIDLLDTPTAGKIFFDGTDTATHEKDRLAIRRRMAMVFQKPAVLNTTVANNVAFGLKFRGVGERRDNDHGSKRRSQSWGSRTWQSARRSPCPGGEMQRVAIARALVTQPEVLLLDEPTANLDPVNSELIEDLILRINREFHTTIISATHDMIQGQRLADRIGVIMDGQHGPGRDLHEIFYQPMGQDVARFVGIDTVLHGMVRENDRGLASIAVGDALFEAIDAVTAGKKVALYIRPEEVTLSPDIEASSGEIQCPEPFYRNDHGRWCRSGRLSG